LNTAVDAIDQMRGSINFQGLSQEGNEQTWTQNNSDDHAMLKSLSVEGPGQNATRMKDSNPAWSGDTQRRYQIVWSNAVDMLNRALEVGGQAMEVGHGAFANMKDDEENGDVSTQEGESTDSDQVSYCSDKNRKEQPEMSSSAVHDSAPLDQVAMAPLPQPAQNLLGEDGSAEGVMEDDISGQEKQSSDQNEEMDPERFLSAVEPCHSNDAFTWVRETMPVTASCQGPSESKEPVYLEALHHEMPKGLRKERNLKKFLKEESKGPALFGKVVDPSSKTGSGMACPDLSQDDQEALKKMLQMWAPGPDQGDDGGDLSPGLGHDGTTKKEKKKSWAARCVPCRGKLPADNDVQTPLRKNAKNGKVPRKGIFRFLSPHGRNT
jgi:hypothetical protein